MPRGAPLDWEVGAELGGLYCWHDARHIVVRERPRHWSQLDLLDVFSGARTVLRRFGRHDIDASRRAAALVFETHYRAAVTGWKRDAPMWAARQAAIRLPDDAAAPDDVAVSPDGMRVAWVVHYADPSAQPGTYLEANGRVDVFVSDASGHGMALVARFEGVSCPSRLDLSPAIQTIRRASWEWRRIPRFRCLSSTTTTTCNSGRTVRLLPQRRAGGSG